MCARVSVSGMCVCAGLRPDVHIHTGVHTRLCVRVRSQERFRATQRSGGSGWAQGLEGRVCGRMARVPAPDPTASSRSSVPVRVWRWALVPRNLLERPEGLGPHCSLLRDRKGPDVPGAPAGTSRSGPGPWRRGGSSTDTDHGRWARKLCWRGVDCAPLGTWPQAHLCGGGFGPVGPCCLVVSEFKDPSWARVLRADVGSPGV